MSASGRRAIWFLFVPVLAVAVLGLLALWGIRSFLAGPAPIRSDAPTQLASVSVRWGPNSLAWAADSNALYAIEDPEPRAIEQKAAVRPWAVAAFAEQPAITAPQVYRYEAIAVSPDGGTLAVADVGQGLGGKTRLVRLFNLATGAERASSRAAPAGNSPPRLGFTPDSKAVGVFDTDTLSWWDVVTGGSANRDPVRFAIQPAGLSDTRNVASTDGRWWAEGYGRRRDFADIGAAWDGREHEFGAFVRVTESAPAKTWTWRVGQGDPPTLAFSPDGTKLAGTVSLSSGESIVI
jgi:hypothetical protein